jgi:hypothetical protein
MSTLRTLSLIVIVTACGRGAGTEPPPTLTPEPAASGTALDPPADSDPSGGSGGSGGRAP